MSRNLPQPYEGIAGTVRQDDLLSLEAAAIPRRIIMTGIAVCLYRAVLVGDPAPVVQRMAARMRAPEPGDLVLEMSTRFRRSDSDTRIQAFGILLAHREEWWQSDEQWAAEIAGEPEESRGENSRASDHAWYIQYGPQPADIARWTDCEFIAVPSDPAAFIARIGTRNGSGVMFTRDDIISGLADSGFRPGVML